MKTKSMSLLMVAALLFSVILQLLFSLRADASEVKSGEDFYVASFYEGDTLVYEAFFKKPSSGGVSSEKLKTIPAVSDPVMFGDWVLEDGTVATVGYSPAKDVTFRAIRKKDASVSVNLKDDNSYYLFNPVDLVIKKGYTNAALYLPPKDEVTIDEATFICWEDEKSKKTYSPGEIVNVYDNLTLKAKYTVNESYINSAKLKVKYIKREAKGSGVASDSPLLKPDGSAYDTNVNINDKNYDSLNIAFPKAEGLEVREVVYSESLELFGVTETSVGGIKGLKNGSALKGKEYEATVYYENKSDAKIVYRDANTGEIVKTGDNIILEMVLLLAAIIICVCLLIAIKKIKAERK